MLDKTAKELIIKTADAIYYDHYGIDPTTNLWECSHYVSMIDPLREAVKQGITLGLKGSNK
jgi:Ni,Fe-hydrogenase I large subunit